jgi:hypothetical protein
MLLYVPIVSCDFMILPDLSCVAVFFFFPLRGEGLRRHLTSRCFYLIASCQFNCVCFDEIVSHLRLSMDTHENLAWKSGKRSDTVECLSLDREMKGR